VPGCPATHCSPACLLAKKCTKWQKFSITPESKGPPGRRNDTTASGWEVAVTPSGVTVSGQAEVTRPACPSLAGRKSVSQAHQAYRIWPPGLVPVLRGELADRQAPEPGHPALAVGEHARTGAECLGDGRLGKAGGRGQVRRDGAAALPVLAVPSWFAALCRFFPVTSAVARLYQVLIARQPVTAPWGTGGLV
jgi:hypothetical protein